MKKTVIVTGAAGNLGKDITANLLKDGYAVEAIVGPKDDTKFIDHIQLKAHKINLLNSDETLDFINSVVANQSKNVVAVICLVGGFIKGDISRTMVEDIQKMFDLNFKTVYNVTKPLIDSCKKENKPLQIIFIGSRPGIHSEEGKELVAYGLSKSLIFRLAEYIDEDANTTGINASVIVPSTLDTPGTRSAMPEADPNQWVPVDEVSNTIAFILSDSGKMMRNTVYKLYNKA